MSPTAAVGARTPCEVRVCVKRAPIRERDSEMTNDPLHNPIGFRRDGRPIYPIAGAASTPAEILQRALSAPAPVPAGSSARQIVEARRRQLMDARGQALDLIEGEHRGVHASEERAFAAMKTQMAEVDERLAEITDNEQREARAAACRAQSGMGGVQSFGPAYANGPGTYQRGNPGGPSFFKDLINARSGDYEAVQRLHQNNAEARAIGNTGATGGSGAEFAPPEWLVSEFVKLARPGRITADLLNVKPLPAGVSSINIPKILTGTATAIQSTQNTQLPEVDITTASVTSPITTIGGKQVVSQQLLDQSAIPFDEMILGDLAADYARQLDLQVIGGSGSAGQLRGLLGVTGATAVTFAQATPAVMGAGGLYSKLGQLSELVHSTRFLPLTHWVMHPRRWAWIATAQDTTGRPLVVPDGGGYNNIATAGAPAAQGMAGSLFGLPVYLDPNLPTNLGAGTNQDVILGLRANDMWLWESSLKADAVTATYADSLGVLFRVYAYSAAIPDRYPASVGIISGTGLVAPTFA